MSVQMENGSKPFELALNTGTSSGSGRLEIDYELITLQWQKQNTYMNYQCLKASLNAEARLYITEENVRMLTGTTADINWHQFNFGWNSAHWLAATKLSYVELNTDSFVRARVGLLTVGGSDIEINNAILWWAEPKISYRGNFNSLAYQLTLAHWIPIHLNLTTEELDASASSDQATTTTDLDSNEGYRFGNGLSMHFRLSYKF